MKQDLFVLCGEISGDQHVYPVLQALLQKHPSIKVEGVLGPQLRGLNIKEFLPMEDFCLMGFIDVFLHLPKVIYQFYKLLHHLLKTKPKAILFVDYPGLNLRLAKKLRHQGYEGKLIQLVCPQVWAWKRKRIKSIEKYLDLLLCIFPFEPALFKNQQRCKVFYTGNPTQEHIQATCFSPHWKRSLGLKDSQPLIGIFPGSRKKELSQNLPTLLQAIKIFKNNEPVNIAISVADTSLKPILFKLCEQQGLNPKKDLLIIDKQESLNLMKNADFVLAKCGTNNLELALCQTPTVVVYQVSFFNYFIAKYILRIKLKFFCLVNILLQKEVFKELITPHFSVSSVLKALKSLYNDPKAREVILKDCQQLSTSLASKNYTQETLKQIEHYLAF